MLLLSGDCLHMLRDHGAADGGGHLHRGLDDRRGLEGGPVHAVRLPRSQDPPPLRHGKCSRLFERQNRT